MRGTVALLFFPRSAAAPLIPLAAACLSLLLACGLARCLGLIVRLLDGARALALSLAIACSIKCPLSSSATPPRHRRR